VEEAMPRARRAVPLLAVFLAGAAAGAFAAKKVLVSPAAFSGREPAAAADALLDSARALAEAGSYENIAVARVYYLSGRKVEGQQILDRVMAGKTKPGDLMRVARLYREAGEWERAKPLFESVLRMAPEDEDWLAEIGAYYNLHGDRARAEELFRRSFELDPESYKNLATAAGSYVGVSPAVDI
jgi:tetratricopeptide (TPR) repeat protein